MADFDLSLVATFDTQQAEAGAARLEGSVDKLSAAEKRGAAANKEAAQAERDAAKAERERAAAIDAVRAAIEPGYAAQQRMNGLLAQAEELYRGNAITLRQLEQVQRLHSQAMAGGARSAGEMSRNSTQLGFQIQDITQSLALGVNPLVVFGQQAGQTSAALAGMGGTLGRVGTFLSGPYGSIILAAVTVTGLLATSFLSADDAGEKLESTIDSLSDQFDVATLSAEDLAAVQQLLSRELGTVQRTAIGAANAMRIKAEADRAAAVEAINLAKAEYERIAAFSSDPQFAEGNLAYAGQLSRLDSEIERLNGVMADFDRLANRSAFNVAILTSSLSENERQAESLRQTIDGLRQAYTATGNRAFLDSALGFQAQIDALEERGGSPRSNRDSRRETENRLERLREYGTEAAEQIRRINERFDEQPRLIDSAAQASRQLDAIIAELGQRRPPNFEALIADARTAKEVIVDGLLRPFEEVLEASERRMQVQRLIAAGREDEAAALQIIWQLEEKLGPLGRERRQEILDTVIAERELTDELRARQEITDAYLDATRSARQEVEALLSGSGRLSNFKDIFRQLSSRVLTEQLFGSIFRDLETFVRQETGIKDSVDILSEETERAGRSAGDFADTLDDVVRRMSGVATGETAGPSEAAFDDFLRRFDNELGRRRDGDDVDPSDMIVVSAIRGGVNGMTPERYFEELTKRLVTPLLNGIDEALGTEFFGKLEGVFSGAVSGYMTGGVPGGILGALKGIKGLPEGITAALDKALGGAKTGTTVSSIGDLLGIKNSKTGAQIGGALGSFLPIPGGDIIGAVAGGLIGGLFKKTPFGTARVTSGGVTATGRGEGRLDGATATGTSVQDSLQNIADALDARLGSFAVSIGTLKDDFVVSPSGKDGKLKGGDVRNFGQDEAAAVAFAIADAIADGAIQGISPAVAAALKSSPDIQKATAEAIKVADLERSLKFMGDSVAEAFDDFRKTAADRVELARKYGLDLLKVEELNAKERKQLLDDALDRSVGSLRSLLDDLKFGSLFEGTASQRRQRLLSEIADAKEDVGAGVSGATDRLAALERQLVETSREAFGTAGGEYATDRAQAINTAQTIIAAEQKRLEEAAAATQQGLALANETNELLSGVNGRLDTLIGQVASTGATAPQSPPQVIPGRWSDFGGWRGMAVPY